MSLLDAANACAVTCRGLRRGRDAPRCCCTHTRDTPAALRTTKMTAILPTSTQPYVEPNSAVGDPTSRTAWMTPVSTRATTEPSASPDQRGSAAPSSPAGTPG